MNLGIHPPWMMVTCPGSESEKQLPNPDAPSIVVHQRRDVSMLLCSTFFTAYVLLCFPPRQFNLRSIGPQNVVPAVLWSVMVNFGKPQACGDVSFFQGQRLPLWWPAMDTRLYAATHHCLLTVDSWIEMLTSSSNSFKPLAVTLGLFSFYRMIISGHLSLTPTKRESSHRAKPSPFIVLYRYFQRVE